MTSYFAGTDQPVPDVLTRAEAAAYLRLDQADDEDGRTHPRELSDSIRSLDALARPGRSPRLHPIKVGRCVRYSLADLARFIDPTA